MEDPNANATSRLRIRNQLNNAWMDLSQSEVYVRDPDNLAWLRLVPGELLVRNQTNAGWILIDNTPEPDIDDPCASVVIPGSCNGGMFDKALGSGSGNGSGGPAFDLVEGYPAGYDMPDSSMTGFGVEVIPQWPTNRALRRPGANTLESYDNAPTGAHNGDSTFENPAFPNSTVFGRGAAITEFFYLVGDAPGFVDVTWVSWNDLGVSVDIYYLGERVATSCGMHEGRNRIRFYYDPALGDGEERVMVRVRGPEACRWWLQMRNPREDAATETLDKALDYYKTYNVTSMPDILSPHYLGTPIFPAPCHAMVYVSPDRLTQRGHFEYHHHVGNLGGYMYLDFKSWNDKDFVEVYHYGRRIATTLDAKTGRGYLRFLFDPSLNACEDIVVRVVSENFEDGDPTSVYYALWCPETAGAREQRHPCGVYEVTSAGHPWTEDNFTITGFASDMCGILINCIAGSQKSKFEVFDVNDNLLDTSIVEAGQQGTLEYWAPPNSPEERSVSVRVTSGIGCNWRIFVNCAIQKPDVEVPHTIVPFTCIETPKQPELPGFEGLWKCVLDNLNTNKVRYPWREDCEYYIITDGDNRIFSRNVIPYAPIAMGIPSGDMFWNRGDDEPEVVMGRDNKADPATGWIRSGHRLRQVYERGIIISDDRDGDPFDNSWKIVANGKGKEIKTALPWTEGYEYMLFANDVHGKVEISMHRFFFPKGYARRKTITFSNSTDFHVDTDGTMRAAIAWNYDYHSMLLLRRPIFDSISDADMLGWRKDFEDWGACRDKYQPFAWKYGREYAIRCLSFICNDDQHYLATHRNMAKLGRNSISAAGYGVVNFVNPEGGGIDCSNDDYMASLIYSRPFFVEGFD